jgi:2'-hydroxyisoflavone reductase
MASVPRNDAVTRLVGNRDPRVAPGLAALDRGDWDAVLDTSGYVPRCVRGAAQKLAGRVGHYTFVSSMSVYADASRAGQDEDAPVARLDDAASENVQEQYGALKAACEDEIRAAFADRALLVRPGLIVGPHDPTDRFAYWVARFLRPELLGARAPVAVVPAPPSRPIQFIDARDLAVWLVDAATTQCAGTFNACSPQGLCTMGTLVTALVERSARAERAIAPCWVDDATLVAGGVVPWTGLPLWIPAGDRGFAGFMEFDCSRAIAQGLRIRPLAETIDDTAVWLDTRREGNTWRGVLTAQAERELLASR